VFLCGLFFSFLCLVIPAKAPNLISFEFLSFVFLNLFSA
jgi:hypothetical protein